MNDASGAMLKTAKHAPWGGQKKKASWENQETSPRDEQPPTMASALTRAKRRGETKCGKATKGHLRSAKTKTSKR